MFTSHFAYLKFVPQGLRPVAICRGIPKWYKGDREQRLAPLWNMLKLPELEFDRRYNEILLNLEPKVLYDALGDNAVMLCWEPRGKHCHRRNAAEWFERHLNVVIPELGEDRRQTGWQSTRNYHFWRPEVENVTWLGQAMAQTGEVILPDGEVLPAQAPPAAAEPNQPGLPF